MLLASPPAPSITSFSPASAAVAAKVVVLGKHFTKVKWVKVDGRTAKFKLDSAGKLTVTIPAKAKSGKIEVETVAGTATSAKALAIKA